MCCAEQELAVIIRAYGLCIEAASAALERLDSIVSSGRSISNTDSGSGEADSLIRSIELYQSIGATGGHTTLAQLCASNSDIRRSANESENQDDEDESWFGFEEDMIDTGHSMQIGDGDSSDTSDNNASLTQAGANSIHVAVEAAMQVTSRWSDPMAAPEQQQQQQQQLLATLQTGLLQSLFVDAQVCERLIKQTFEWLRHLNLASVLSASSLAAILHSIHSVAAVHTQCKRHLDEFLEAIGQRVKQYRSPNDSDRVAAGGSSEQLVDSIASLPPWQRVVLLNCIDRLASWSTSEVRLSATASASELHDIVSDLRHLVEEATQHAGESDLDTLLARCRSRCNNVVRLLQPPTDTELTELTEVIRVVVRSARHGSLQGPLALLQDVIEAVMRGTVALSVAADERATLARQALATFVQRLLELLLSEFTPPPLPSDTSAIGRREAIVNTLPSGLLLDWLFRLPACHGMSHNHGAVYELLPRVAFGPQRPPFAEAICSWMLHDWPWRALRNCVTGLVQAQRQLFSDTAVRLVVVDLVRQYSKGLSHSQQSRNSSSKCRTR